MDTHIFSKNDHLLLNFFWIRSEKISSLDYQIMEIGSVQTDFSLTNVKD